MVSTAAVWHGTNEENFALAQAIAPNCDCQFGMMGIRVATCTLHKAMQFDQHWLDHMLWARRMAARWRAGEEKP